jgi:hypothetical protein
VRVSSHVERMRNPASNKTRPTSPRAERGGAGAVGFASSDVGAESCMPPAMLFRRCRPVQRQCAPACSGGHPACRRTGASRPAEKTLAHTNRAEKFQNRTHLPSFFPGGGTPALYGRRDVCRYNAFAAFPRGISNCAHVNWNCHS